MKKRLLIRSLIGLVAGAMMAHLFTLLSNQLTKVCGYCVCRD